jgi:hypothetical protein
MLILLLLGAGTYQQLVMLYQFMVLVVHQEVHILAVEDHQVEEPTTTIISHHQVVLDQVEEPTIISHHQVVLDQEVLDQEEA